jgi:hypothetical protein
MGSRVLITAGWYKPYQQRSNLASGKGPKRTVLDHVFDLAPIAEQPQPWNGRNLCIGIEPCCSAFGMSPATCGQSNPINRTGVPTSVDLRAGQTFTIAYSMRVAPTD